MNKYYAVIRDPRDQLCYTIMKESNSRDTARKELYDQGYIIPRFYSEKMFIKRKEMGKKKFLKFDPKSDLAIWNAIDECKIDSVNE